MVVDDDVLEKDDLFILDRMKEFITAEEVARFPAAKQLLILIERAVSVPSIFTYRAHALANNSKTEVTA
jgi:son of sevenless-like protein